MTKRKNASSLLELIPGTGWDLLEVDWTSHYGSRGDGLGVMEPLWPE